MSLDSMLGGSSLPAVKWSNPDRTPRIGHHVSGVVLDADKKLATDTEGNVKTFSDGNPIKQLVITLETDERDPEITEDDGRRLLYCSRNAERAIREAVTKASADAGHKVEFDRGGRLVLQLTGVDAPKKRGYTGEYVFAARYAEGTLDTTVATGYPAVDDATAQTVAVRSIDDLA